VDEGGDGGAAGTVEVTAADALAGAGPRDAVAAELSSGHAGTLGAGCTHAQRRVVWPQPAHWRLSHDCSRGSGEPRSPTAPALPPSVVDPLRWRSGHPCRSSGGSAADTRSSARSRPPPERILPNPN
jgi:hypothetical protein